MCKKWTEEEIAELRRLWWNHTPKEVFSLFTKYSEKSIGKKVWELGISRSPETSQRILENKKKILVHRNTTILGRERNYDNAKLAAASYTNSTEFYRKDSSMYQYIKQNGWWDDLCSHMAIGSYNYSESFLFECVKCLFPGKEVVRNTRKVIKPYELDIYVPSAQTAFEYDGSNWHNASEVVKRDATKSELCAKAGIVLHRIQEVRENRNRPEASIVNALSIAGYDVSKIDIASCSELAFANGYSDERIRECVSKYTTLRDFRKNEVPLYTILTKKGLLGKYLSGLYRHIADNSPVSIDVALANCNSASEFREKHLGMYVAMRKNPDNYKDQLGKYAELLPPGYAQDANGKRMGRCLTYNGKTQSIDDWAAEVGMPVQLISKRLNCGWSMERAMTTPRRIRRSQKST